MSVKGKKWVYFSALLFVVIFWGISSVVYHYFYRYYSAAVLTCIMTLFSALFFWIQAKKRLKQIDGKFLKIALPICLLNAVANVLQRIGLQYTTPANYAFFEHLSCVVVPVMMFVFIRQTPSLLQGIGAVTCLIGCFVLCGVSFSGGSAIGVGDLLCIISGLLMGVCVAAIGAYTRHLDGTLFMVVYMTCYFGVSLILAFVLNTVGAEPAVITWKIPVLLLVIVFGLVDVALCWLLKTEAIRHIDPVAVATISPCTAVITGAVSVWAGIDQPTPRLLIGGGVIFLSALIPELLGTLAIRRKAYRR